MSVVPNDLELYAMAISSTLHACRVLRDHDTSNGMGYCEAKCCTAKLTGGDASLDF